MTTTRRPMIAIAICTGILGALTLHTWNPYTAKVDAATAAPANSRVIPLNTPGPATMDPAPVLLSGYWERMTPTLAQSMLEFSPYPNDHAWMTCKVHEDWAWTSVRCPDGYEEHWSKW